jgi:hypothetical protein
MDAGDPHIHVQLNLIRFDAANVLASTFGLASDAHPCTMADPREGQKTGCRRGRSW